VDIGIKTDLANTLNSIGGILRQKGESERAFSMFEEAANILKEADKSSSTLICCYNNIGLIHEERGNLEKALEYHDMAEALCIELGLQYRLSRCYGYKAGIYKKMGESEKALELYRKEEHIGMELGMPQGQVSAMAHQAVIYMGHEYRKYKKALVLARDAAYLAREHGYHDMTRYLTNLRNEISRIIELQKAGITFELHDLD
jgi:tetratricopeptide (TPR) repeat protein